MRRYPYSYDPSAFHVQAAKRFDKIRGSEAITITGLCPTGLILLAGRPVPAICRNLSIPVGTKVRIIDQSFNQLVVELLEIQDFS